MGGTSGTIDAMVWGDEGVGWASAAGEPANLTGRLLVATPVLAEATFRRTVVIVLDHDEQGALGVVLNRPSPLPVRRVLPQWETAVAPPPVIFEGGPVAADSAVALAALTGPVPSRGPELGPAGLGPVGLGGMEPPGWRQVVGSLGLLDVTVPPEEIRDRLAALRIFVGYAGWGAGQLEHEIAADAWYVVAAAAGDVFTDSPETLWRAVLRRQADAGLAIVSTFPDDPALN